MLEREMMQAIIAIGLGKGFGKDVKKHIKKLERLREIAKKEGHWDLAIFIRGKLQEYKGS